MWNYNFQDERIGFLENKLHIIRKLKFEAIINVRVGDCEASSIGIMSFDGLSFKIRTLEYLNVDVRVLRSELQGLKTARGYRGSILRM